MHWFSNCCPSVMSIYTCECRKELVIEKIILEFCITKAVNILLEIYKFIKVFIFSSSLDSIWPEVKLWWCKVWHPLGRAAFSGRVQIESNVRVTAGVTALGCDVDPAQCVFAFIRDLLCRMIRGLKCCLNVLTVPFWFYERAHTHT